MSEQFAYTVISVIILNTHHNAILIQKRKKERLNKDYWELPQGKLRQGENIVQCAKREVLEETGLSELKLISNITHKGMTNFMQSFVRALFFCNTYYC
jgi:8-oxo-dGTP pyrophosphatase MutT (NUDIX family)